MSNPITTVNGVQALDVASLRPHEVAAVFVQGDANNFVWSIQAKASSDLSFVDLPSASGVTGANSKEFRPSRDVVYQVKVTNMGTATKVYVRTN